MDSSAHDKQTILISTLIDFSMIHGRTHSETSRNFSAFERSLDFELFDPDIFDPEVFLAELNPRTVCEELLRIKLLRKYKRYEDSLRTLIEGPAFFSKRILSDSKLIEYISERYSGDNLVHEILEGACYRTRTRLINKLAFQIKDEDKGLEFFTAVSSKYGLKVAKPLLIACAKDVIIQAIQEDEVQFRHAELFKCYEKSKEILWVYFKENENFHEYVKLAQYLCFNDLDYFHGLVKYGFPKLGKGAFRRYLNVYKREFIEDAKNSKGIKSDKFKWTCLSENEMVVWYKNLLPKDVADFGWDFPWLLEMLPRKNRGRVLFEAFRVKYGFDLWNLERYDPIPMLEVLALEDRRKFDLSELVQFESTEKAIPILEKQLKFTNQLHKRIFIINSILKNCKYNNDYEALLKFLKTFVEFHKNEMKSVRLSVIEDLINYFNFNKFTEEHWNCVDKIILECHINNDYNYPLSEIVFELVKHRIPQGLNCELYFKIIYKTTETFYFPKFTTENPEMQRKAILNIRSIMEDVKSGHINFIDSVVKFNHGNRKNKSLRISLGDYKDSLKIVTEDLQNKYTSFHELNKLLKSLEDEKGDFDDILEALMVGSFKRRNGFAQSWFLNFKPHLIENNIEVLFKNSKLQEKFMRAFLILESPLKNKILKHAVRIIINWKEKESEEVCRSLQLLSLTPHFNLSKHTKSWMPVELKIDAHKEGVKELFDIQKALIKSYKTRCDLLKVIPELLQFCKGDYLKHALETLYYISTNIPEKDLIPILEQLSARSIYARKHALIISTHSCSLESKRKLLKRSLDAENDPQMRKIILKNMRKCLRDDRTEHDWAFFSSHLHFFDPEDKEINELAVAKNIPRKYYTKFVGLLWNLLQQRGMGEEFKLLEFLDYKKFHLANCAEDLVKKSLFNSRNKQVEATYNFVLNYVINSAKFSGADLENKFEIISKCIQERTEGNGVYEFQKTLYEFFAFFCKKLLARGNNERFYKNKNLFKIIKVMNDKNHLFSNRNFLISLLLKTTILYYETVQNSSLTVSYLYETGEKSNATVSYSSHTVENSSTTISHLNPTVENSSVTVSSPTVDNLSKTVSHSSPIVENPSTIVPHSSTTVEHPSITVSPSKSTVENRTIIQTSENIPNSGISTRNSNTILPILAISNINEHNFGLRHFSKCLLQDLTRLIEKHGFSIVNVYTKFVVNFLNLLDEEKNIVFDIIDEIISCDNSKEIKSFCVGLLPDVVPKSTILREKYFELMNKLASGCYVTGLEIDGHVLSIRF